MDPDLKQVTSLRPPEESEVPGSRSKMQRKLKPRDFTFDRSFWSHNEKDPHFANQEDVYDSLGEEFLNHNFEGYNTCIFAYGQTGSGKSYTMMGTPEQPGLIPRTCEDLFQRIEADKTEAMNITYSVYVSYFEIYNEVPHDLLAPLPASGKPRKLKIRNGPEGVYIPELREMPVQSLEDIMGYIRTGDNLRTTASTKMNDTSSRSHAVFTIMLKQIEQDIDGEEAMERSSSIRLVDLAGSERADRTGATGDRLREGAKINQSLTTLRRVIEALTDAKRPSKNLVVPYRDSALTWLLKDSLGGNSKTALIACIAPSDYDETLSTLKFASDAKRIRTLAHRNEGNISAAERDAQIAAMAEEIRALQREVSDSRRRENDMVEQEEKLSQYQTRVTTMQRMMEEKTLVAQGKIRKLEVENEALRLHLKLALDSLKNPIPAVKVVEADDEDGALKAKGLDCEGREEDKENMVDEAYYEDEDDGNNGSFVSDTYDYEDANEMQDYMGGLLQDLKMFKRKIGDDKDRWKSSTGIRDYLKPRVNV